MTAYEKPVGSALATVGNTPLVELAAGPLDVQIYAKLETFNPGGSVKDRIGKYMLEKLLERGEISPGGTVIEPTAGNTGIGLAIAANVLGLNAIFMVPEQFSREKHQLMRALGAEIISIPSDEGMKSAIERAHELASEMENAIVPQQFSNPLNAEAHYNTTGPEIYHALEGRVGTLVLGCGTVGTLTGTARFMREKIPDIYVAAVEPEGSVFGRLLGQDSEEAEYNIEGIGTHDTSNKKLFETELVDEVIQVSDRNAHSEVKRLAEEEGHLTASSSGAASWAAIQTAHKIARGELEVPYNNVVTLFPDSGERYLSNNLYASYEEWVSDEK